jgi:SPP1 family phage portal protein
MSVLFDMDTIRKCGWYIAAHGRAYMEVRFNEDGKMSGISAHDPGHCFEFTDSDTREHGFVIIEEVKNEFGLNDEENADRLSVRIIEESDDKSQFTITQYFYADNNITQLSYIPQLTINRLEDGKLRKYNGDIVMELFADPFKIGIYKENKSLIDEYDDMASQTSDYLKKSPRSPLIVKGYGSTMSELVTNLYHYNVIPTQADGDVSLLKAEQDINAAQKHLLSVEDSLREQTGWVKSELGNVGYSGAALRMRYAELDIQAQHLQAVMTDAFNSIKLYIRDSLGSEIPEDVEVNFDSDVSKFPSDLQDIVGSLYAPGQAEITKNQLIAKIYEKLLAWGKS